MDIWARYKVGTHSGMRFFPCLIDNCTEWTWVFLKKLKYDVIVLLKNLIGMVQTQLGKTIKIFRSGNNGEFNTTCTELCQLHDILHQNSCPYTRNKMRRLSESTNTF